MDNFVSVDIYLRFFVAFGLVILLIGLAAWLAKFIGFNIPLRPKGQREHRLAVIDSIALDAKRRLILISRDDVEHLLCIGGITDFIVESNVRTISASMNKQVVSNISGLKASQREL